jgi:hypothetical protein
MDIITNNYLQNSSILILLTNNKGWICISHVAAMELCMLKPKLNRILKQVSIVGTMNYYIDDLEALITNVEYERHFDFKSCKFVSKWTIETCGVHSSTRSLRLTKRQLDLLYTQRDELDYKLCDAIDGMRQISRCNNSGVRPIVQSLAVECKWAIFNALKEDKAVSNDILEQLPLTVQEFLLKWP